MVVTAGLVTSLAVASPARAAVNPKGKDARFISLIDRDCRGFDYKVQGFMKKTKDKAPAWHTWEGTVGCFQKAVFAWEPANPDAEIIVVIKIDGEVDWGQIFDGDRNYCLALKRGGDWEEKWSDVGGGGSGSCTAD
jgi:hypothetical protein